MRRLVGPLRFAQSATCTWPWKGAKSSDSGLLGGMPISKTGFDLVSRPKRYQPRWPPLSRLRDACFRHCKLADGSPTCVGPAALGHLFSGPAAIFAPHAVFVAGLCDNCLTACSCLPTALYIPCGCHPTANRFAPQAGVEKGTQTPGKEMVGTVTLKQIYHIAQVRPKSSSPSIALTTAATTSPAAWLKQRRGHAPGRDGWPAAAENRACCCWVQIKQNDPNLKRCSLESISKQLMGSAQSIGLEVRPNPVRQHSVLLGGRAGPNKRCAGFWRRSCGTKGGKRPTRRLRRAVAANLR